MGTINKSMFVTPAGAGIAIICFFLPWARFSYVVTAKSYTGADIGGYAWIILAAAIVIFAAFFLFLAAGKVRWSIPVTLVGTVTAYALMAVRLMDAKKGEIEPLNIKLTILYGGILTILGFLLAIIGAFTLNRKSD